MSMSARPFRMSSAEICDFAAAEFAAKQAAQPAVTYKPICPGCSTANTLREWQGACWSYNNQPYCCPHCGLEQTYLAMLEQEVVPA